MARKSVEVEVDIDLDNFTNEELIDELEGRDLSPMDLDSVRDLLNDQGETEDKDNCIIINNVCVYEIESLADILKVEEFIESLKK